MLGFLPSTQPTGDAIAVASPATPEAILKAIDWVKENSLSASSPSAAWEEWLGKEQLVI